ncbi:MAG: toxin-antitoxin system YwqK family antitoxin [Bacteroidales bacterium]|nr:toxin-antitoxin system YwqK family antitoxin [Bacteroidales bacterium]
MKKIILTLSMMLFVIATYSQQIYNLKTSDFPDGKYEKYIGTIRVTGEVLNGMKEGSWVENHPNTDLPHYIIQYEEGKKDGLYLEFDKSANIIKKIDYKNDMMDGLNCVWFKGGRSSVKQEYKEGKLEGLSILYYDNGFIQEESEYKDGKRNGVTIWYSYADKEQGPKAVMYTYKDGLFEGVQETYYEDGRLKSQKMFSNNVANGVAIELYEDGSIKSESNYKNGELKGRVKEYKKGEKFVN